MLYAIIATDHPNSGEKRKQIRPAHVERLQELAAAGRLVIAGPHPAAEGPGAAEAGFTGSLIVADFADRAAAEQWLAEDPYILHEVYADVTIKPFRKILP